MQAYGLDHTYSEHFVDSAVHIIGCVAALIGATALLVWALVALPATHIAPLVAYSIGLIATFLFSAAYNMTLHVRTRAVLRRFDHAAIFIMIAGTYTPMAFIGIGGEAGIRLALAAWLIAGLGVFLKLFFFHRFYHAVFVLYLVQGWLALTAILPMMQNLSPVVLVLITIGGLTYTAGTLFHKNEGWAYNRAIWHGFVLIAAALHYSAVFQIARV